MTSSEYEDIYSIFLGKITDPELASEKQKIAYEYMNEYLIAVASDPAIRKLFSSITFDDDMEEVTFALNRSIDDSYDQRFVNNLLATGMLVEWIRPQLNSKVLMAQFFGGKEQQFYAQSNHMNALRNLFEKAESELSKMTAKHAYAEFTLNGVS